MDDFDIPENSDGDSGVPITPIMDMLVAIVFFLLLSSSFYDLTQQGLPAKQDVEPTVSQGPKPPSPRLYVSRVGESLQSAIVWSGENGGQRVTIIDAPQLEVALPALTSEIIQLVSFLRERFPTESFVQIGLSGSLPYQVLIAVLDGVHRNNLGVVLVSDDDVSAYIEGQPQQRSGVFN